MNDGESGTDPPGGPDDREGEPSIEPSENDEKWRFTLEDIEARQAEASAAAEAEARRREPIKPGDPSVEGTVFVLLGVAFALFVISRPLIG